MFGFLKGNRHATDTVRAPHVGCLGKLPIYTEFIRHNVNGRSVIDLDDWVQQGHLHHSRAIQASNNKPKLPNFIYNFVFSGSGDLSSTVIGTIMSSQDKSGRYYPFLLFKVLATTNTVSLASTLPCAYERFFTSAQKLCSTDWSLQPITMLKKRVDALYPEINQINRCNLMELEIASLQKLKRNEFWRQSLGEAAEYLAPYCVEVMHDLLAAVARKSPLRTSWGIEIPMPANDQAHIYVTFWVRIAEAVLGDRGWRAHFVWGKESSGEAQRLYLFFRPISPIFLSHLMGHKVNNGILINLDQECVRQKTVSAQALEIGDTSRDDDLVDVANKWSNWSKG